MKKATKVAKPKTQSFIPFSVHQTEEVIMMPPHSECIPYVSYSFWLSTVQLRMYVREKQADMKISEEGGRPISTIFMLRGGLSQLVTMVTFFCPLSSLFRRTDHPPKICPVA